MRSYLQKILFAAMWWDAKQSMNAVSLRNRDILYDSIQVRRSIPSNNFKLIASGSDVTMDMDNVVEVLVGCDGH